jgi:hypothetical protein
MRFGSYGTGDSDAIGAHNPERPEASFGLAPEVPSCQRATYRSIVTAGPALQQLSFLAAQAAAGVRRMAQ